MSALLGGALGAASGLAGALAGHASILLSQGASGGSATWLKGPYGPPFFDLVLATGVFYAFAAGGSGRGSWRRRSVRAAASGGAAVLVLAVPLAIATRRFRWGEDTAGPTWSWVYLVLGCYAAANAAGCWAAGWVERPRSWSAGAWTLSAGAAAWLVDRAVQWALSGVMSPTPSGLWPPAAALVSGAIWGAAIALGLRQVQSRGTA